MKTILKLLLKTAFKIIGLILTAAIIIVTVLVILYIALSAVGMV